MNVEYLMNHGRIYIFFFIENNGQMFCLISQKTTLVVNEYNIKRHYETKHKLKFNSHTGDLRQIKINNLVSSLNN